MKRLLFVLFLLLIPIAIFCQEPSGPPTSWGDIIMNPGQWFVSFGAISLLTAFVSTFVIGFFKVVKKFPKQLVAWGVGIALLVGSDLLNIGYAAAFPILLAVIHGFAAGLTANGLFDIPILKSVLDLIDGWLNPKKV